MAESFFDKRKKKGLAALLLLLLGGEKKNVLLLVVVGLAAVLTAGIAGITGHLGKWETAGQKAAGDKGRAGQVAGQGVEFAEIKEVSGAAAEMPASSRRVMLAGVPGKARSMRNDAVNYLSRDSSVIADAQAQRKVGDAPEGEPADGVHVGGGGAGKRGLGDSAFGGGLTGQGSVEMVNSGEGLLDGGGMTVTSDKDQMAAGVMAKLGKTPKLNPGGALQGGGGKGTRGEKGGKSSAMKSSRLSSRIFSNSKRVNDPASYKYSKTMYQLVRAAAYTIASLCPNCASEPVTVYNRAYATGEVPGEDGIIALPGEEDPVPVGNTVPETLMTENVSSPANQAADAKKCLEAAKKNKDPIKTIGNEMVAMRWGDDDKSLGEKADCCCRDAYNGKVNEWKGKCAAFNVCVKEVNVACGTDENTDTQDCAQFNEVGSCWYCGGNWCWFSAVVNGIIAIAAIVVAVILIVATCGAATLLVGIAYGALALTSIAVGLGAVYGGIGIGDGLIPDGRELGWW